VAGGVKGEVAEEFATQETEEEEAAAEDAAEIPPAKPVRTC
jgi:hypothetical protein